MERKDQNATLTLAEEDHGAARAAQRLVRCGRDDVGVLKGRRDEAGGDEARDVGHVGQEPETFFSRESFFIPRFFQVEDCRSEQGESKEREREREQAS